MEEGDEAGDLEPVPGGQSPPEAPGPELEIITDAGSKLRSEVSLDRGRAHIGTNYLHGS